MDRQSIVASSGLPHEVRSSRPVPRQVIDVMTTDVVTVDATTAFKEIVAALEGNRISAVPVIDERRHVLGIVSESDLLSQAFGGRLVRPRGQHHLPHIVRPRRAHDTIARDLMSSPAVVTTPETRIAIAARDAAAARVRRLPVVDGGGLLVGIVTRSDLLRPFLRADAAIHEDIVSSIYPVYADACSVNVHVYLGVVTLVGTAMNDHIRSTMVDAIRQVSGVIAVDDRALASFEADMPSDRWSRV